MDKQKATKEIAELLAQNDKNLAQAVKLANKYDIVINLDAPDGTSFAYVPHDGKRPSVDDYWNDGGCQFQAGEGDIPEDWDGEYAGWQNSSTLC